MILCTRNTTITCDPNGQIKELHVTNATNDKISMENKTNNNDKTRPPDKVRLREMDIKEETLFAQKSML